MDLLYSSTVYTRHATQCAQCTVHARSTVTHTHDSCARLHALRHTRGHRTSRATRPRTSILCPQPTPAVGSHRHRTALSSWCTHAQHTCCMAT
eukprot:2412583-Prymnesium_polylepis.1